MRRALEQTSVSCLKEDHALGAALQQRAQQVRGGHVAELLRCALRVQLAGMPTSSTLQRLERLAPDVLRQLVCDEHHERHVRWCARKLAASTRTSGSIDRLAIEQASSGAKDAGGAGMVVRWYASEAVRALQV